MYNDYNYNQNQKPTEVSYYPVDDEYGKNNAKKKKIFAKTIGIILSICIISAGSIGAYKGVTDNWDSISSAFGGAKSSNTNSTGTEQNKADLDSYKNIIELSTKDNALTVPEIYNKVVPSVVGISAEVSGGTQTGTGIIKDKDGYIITNAHVVDGSAKITVVLSDQTQYGATLIGADTKSDLAVIKINANKDLVPAEFGSSDDLVMGESVVAIGNPLGLNFSGSVTGGIVSGLNRKITIEDKTLTLIQTDAAINPGNSGGPLVNSFGQVIGITSAKISTDYAEGMGFAIPINSTISIISDLQNNGYVTGRPLIGLTGENINEMMAQFYNIPQGVYVRFVSASSPAETAGIKAGDVIIGINDTEVKSMDDLNAVKDTKKPGEEVTLTIYRNGKKLNVKLTLAEATN